MDADEREIYLYLKTFKEQFTAEREISRRAGGRKRYQEEEDWAKPALQRMVERGILETNPSGLFRLKPFEKERLKNKKWVSPQVQKILEKSGKDFSNVVMNEDEIDRYYDSL